MTSTRDNPINIPTNAIDIKSPTHWNPLPRDLSEWSLILFNLTPLAGTFFFEWAAFDIIFAYWLESLVIAFFSLIKYATIAANHGGSAERRSPNSTKNPILQWPKTIFGCFFLIVHFGVFMAGHLFAIVSLFGPDTKGLGLSNSEIYNPLTDALLRVWPFLVMLFISHGISFFTNFIGKKEYKKKLPRQLSFMPYGRIVIMHISIFAMAFLFISFKTKVVAAIPIILVKIFTDLIAHRKEHAKIAAREVSAPVGVYDRTSI